VSSVAKPAAPFVDASLALPQAGTMAVPLTEQAAGKEAPTRRWWPWVLGAVVVAGAIGGGIYYYQRRKKRSSKRSKA
jgi:cytochrome c oxidase assembly factor CtaG